MGADVGVYYDGKIYWEFGVRIGADKIVIGNTYRLTIKKDGYKFTDAEADGKTGSPKAFIRKAKIL